VIAARGMLAALLLVAPLRSDYEVWWKRAAGAVRTMGLMGEMGEAELREVALEFLGPERVKVGQVVLYRSHEDLERAAGKAGTDVSYESWLTLLKYRGTGCPEMTEITKIGRAIVQRAVDRECRTKRAVLRGEKDPLLRRVDGVELEILHIVFQPLDYSEKVWGKKSMCLQFYVRTKSEVSIELAREFLLEMKELSRMPEILVVVRNDAWFIEDSAFPAIYPFDGPVEHIPTKEEYQVSQATCGWLYPGPVSWWCEWSEEACRARDD